MNLRRVVAGGVVAAWVFCRLGPAISDEKIDKALELSKQTGMPILAVAGSKT
jgi:hypothetical protein